MEIYPCNRWMHMPDYAAAAWNRQEDKIFEEALVEFPDGIDERWQRIAEFLPGKSAEDVRGHYEVLVHDIGEIDSGRVELPTYSVGSTSIGCEGGGSNSSGQISFGSPKAGSRTRDAERKKGTPWTEDEHRYGKGDWRSISRNVVVTRTPTQVASHAQKYYLRHTSGKKERKRSSIHDITTAMDSLPMPAPTNLPTHDAHGAFQEPHTFPMPR